MIAGKANIKIRRAQLSDAPAVVELLHEAFAAYRPLYTEKGFAVTTPMQNEIEDRINKKLLWLVFSDDRISGTVSLFPRGDELFVRSMAVSPGEQGKGIGKILMEHVHEMAFSNGCSCITLNTTGFLLPAIRLYERFGFKRDGMGDLHGTALIKMTKSLKPEKENKSTLTTS